MFFASQTWLYGLCSAHPTRFADAARDPVTDATGASSRALRALIVDDEPLAREKLRTLLGHEGDVEVVGECGDGLQAVASIERLAPDLVFLDVQMPEIDGFGVLEAIPRRRLPAIIFVTAYDRYALQGVRGARPRLPAQADSTASASTARSTGRARS